MNSARQIRKMSPGGPLRASGFRSSGCTPSSRYRSFSSRTSQYAVSENATYSASTPLLQQPFLRSTIRASAFRLDMLPQRSARSFHVSTQTRQKAAEEKDAKAQSETKDGEEKRESEPKEEKAGDAKGDEKSEDKEKEKKEDLPPPPPHGDKTPWQVFLDTMQTEFKQSKEWNESTKALASSANEFVESESVRKARQAYEATTGAVSSTAAKAVKTTASAIAKGAVYTWETPVVKGVRKGANITGEVLDKATKPIRETEAYKNVKEVIDDGSSSRYGGWVDKEERRRRRELREKMNKEDGVNTPIYEENPNAGTNVTVHKDAAWKEAWRDFRDQNKFVQGLFGMKTVYQESENPLISTARSITDKFAGFFAENETAMVIKKLRTMDPSFKLEPFLQELREYILPEVLDAYVKGDVETLKLWLSEAQYSVYEALTKQYLQAGLKSDGKILDIRGVDILRARMLDPGEIPVFIVTCRTQEVHVYRNAKTNELAAGMEDKVQLVTYAIGITRIAEDVNNPETRGWRLIEMQKSGRDYI
ncbi:TIM44 subunit of mitochondria import inner membrane translocase [Parathielavia appendiculata]|uniref:Mitochondrial import inner membrane translocase subunit TIM44 n=1 Tax=Parathielavia appendiculata TaxID=2587402 RepID=A0AAN6UAR7_9PEZI|nr:TIM44 subunit of mitochondria import inner membrane translocase [Parathielavia appendiculata]